MFLIFETAFYKTATIANLSNKTLKQDIGKFGMQQLKKSTIFLIKFKLQSDYLAKCQDS